MLSGFTGLGVLAGFAVDLCIALRFGLAGATDAYFTAGTLPVVFVAAALGTAHNVLVVALADPSHGPRLFPSLLAGAGLGGIAVAVAGSLASLPLMQVLSPGFDAATLALAAQLSRALFWRVPATLVAEVVRARLYARRQFGWAAAGSAVPSAFALAVLLTCPAADITWAGVAVTLGSWAGLVWLVPAARWRRAAGGDAPAPSLPATRPATPVRRVGRELAASLAGLLVRQVIVMALRWYGSFLPPGSVAALTYADKITQVIAGTLYGGIATAGLPALAAALAAQQRAEAARHWRRLLALSVAVAVPLGAATAALSGLLVPLLFARWLDPAATALLSGVLAVYGLSLIPLGPFRAQQSYLYAARRPGWIATLLALATAVTLALAGPLVQALAAPGLGFAFVAGVTAATAAGFLCVRAIEERSSTAWLG